MRIAAMACNVILVVFTCLVVVTDGPATEAAYVVLMLALVLVPIFSLVVLLRQGRSGSRPAPVKGSGLPEEKRMDERPSRDPGMRTAAIFCNIILFGLSCWAFADQYPHPEEDGFVAYVLILAVAPILNVVALLRSGSGAARLGLRAG